MTQLFTPRTGAEERDITPFKGKFWVYERVMRSRIMESMKFLQEN